MSAKSNRIYPKEGISDTVEAPSIDDVKDVIEEILLIHPHWKNEPVGDIFLLADDKGDGVGIDEFKWFAGALNEHFFNPENQTRFLSGKHWIDGAKLFRMIEILNEFFDSVQHDSTMLMLELHELNNYPDNYTPEGCFNLYNRFKRDLAVAKINTQPLNIRHAADNSK